MQLNEFEAVKIGHLTMYADHAGDDTDAERAVVSVERTDRDAVGLFISGYDSDGDELRELTLYMSIDRARKLMAALGYASVDLT